MDNDTAPLNLQKHLLLWDNFIWELMIIIPWRIREF
jgi:hypothetical protein